MLDDFARVSVTSVSRLPFEIYSLLNHSFIRRNMHNHNSNLAFPVHKYFENERNNENMYVEYYELFSS